jgi:hypothetical protein
MKTTNKMTVILLMLNHFNLFSKPYLSVSLKKETHIQDKRQVCFY